MRDARNPNGPRLPGPVMFACAACTAWLLLQNVLLIGALAWLLRGAAPGALRAVAHAVLAAAVPAAAVGLMALAGAAAIALLVGASRRRYHEVRP